MESHGRVDGLYTLRTSREESVTQRLPAVNYNLYTHLTKYYSNSAEHNFLLITINGHSSAWHWQGTAIQYETRLFPRLSLLTPLLILIHFPLHILSVVFSWHYRHSLTCAFVHLKVTSASLRLYLNWEALGGSLQQRAVTSHSCRTSFLGTVWDFLWACPLSNMTPDHYFLELLHKLLCCLNGAFQNGIL